MSTRAWLWVGFVAAHAWVAVLGYLQPNQPMGDVYLVYEPWSSAALAGHGVIGIDSDFIYPQLALVPMLLANVLSGFGGYVVAWAIVVTLVDAVAFGVLVGSGRSRARATAAGFWLLAIAALGPVGMYRIDGVVVPLAIIALLWLRGRPVAASVLLAVATWIKVWPAALLAAAFVALRQRWTIFSGALVTALAVVAALLLAGGAPHLLGFVDGQTDRGIQVEAPVATAYLWAAVSGAPGASVYYDPEILTFQVTGEGIDVVIALMTPLLALAVLAVLAIGAVKARRGASTRALLPPLALALVLVLIVFNKVGSPQFQTWLFAPVVLWIVLDRRAAQMPAVLVLVSAVATHFIYPVLYYQMLGLAPPAVGLLTARNLLLIVLLVAAVVRLVRVPPRLVPAGQARHDRAS